MVNSKIGVGLIGYSIGRAHAHAWSSLAEYYYPLRINPALVALCGRSADGVERESKKYGFQKCYAKWEDLVRDESISIIDNCGPPSLHAEPMIMAADLGKDLFCEKPLGRNAREAKSMLEAAEKAQVKHMVGYNYRFLPAVSLAREMIKNGELGEIYYFKGAYLNTNIDYDNPKSPLRWQQIPESAGYGALSDLGTHVIDLARFLVGEISSVGGMQSTFVKERPILGGSPGKVLVDDLTVSSMKFKSGAAGLLETFWLASNRTDYLRFEIYGSLGSVRFNLERMNELQVFLREGEDYSNKTKGYKTILTLDKEHPHMKYFWPYQSTGFSWEHTFVAELGHFVKAIEEGSDIAPQGATFYDGYRNCLVMDAIAQSAKTERWINVPDE